MTATDADVMFASKALERWSVWPKSSLYAPGSLMSYPSGGMAALIMVWPTRFLLTTRHRCDCRLDRGAGGAEIQHWRLIQARCWISGLEPLYPTYEEVWTKRWSRPRCEPTDGGIDTGQSRVDFPGAIGQLSGSRATLL